MFFLSACQFCTGVFFDIFLLAISFPFLLEVLDLAFSRKEGEKKQKTFTPHIAGIKGIFFRLILTIGCIPYKAYIEFISVIKTLYRLIFSHKHFLEWMTSEEAEKQSKTTFSNYYKMMFFNVIMGIVAIGIAFYRNDIAIRYLFMLLGILWVITPAIMCKISLIPHRASNTIKEEDKKYLMGVAEKTWQYFKVI